MFLFSIKLYENLFSKMSYSFRNFPKYFSFKNYYVFGIGLVKVYCEVCCGGTKNWDAMFFVLLSTIILNDYAYCVL